MSKKEEQEAFYKKLKAQLEETTKFPAQYLYKFIVVTGADKINEVITLFDNMGAIIDTKLSKNGKYTSISIQVQMNDADAIIAKYLEVSEIEGVISL